MNPNAELQRLADTQLGLLRTDQLAAGGLTYKQIHQRIAAGMIERLSPRVFRVIGASPTQWQSALAAQFDAGAGAAVSHGSALALYRIPRFSVSPVHVTRGAERNRRESNLAFVHEPKLLRPNHFARRGPLVFTSPTRSLFDVARSLTADQLARAVDATLVRRLTNTRALHQMLDVLAKRGRSGIAVMRQVLDERPLGYRPPESHLEARVQKIVVDGGLPAPERQVDVGDDDGWIARVDFLFRALRLILFVDGDFWHSTISDRAADADQQARLERAGFQVERISEATVFLEPHMIVRPVAHHRRELRAVI